jgi:hypothetical protein
VCYVSGSVPCLLLPLCRATFERLTAAMSKDVSTIPKRARNVSFRSLYRRDNADDPIPRQASRPAFTHKHGAKQPPLTHLSQWHVCEFADAAGHKFLSVVRWMMWRKVGVSGDAVAADAILSAAYSLTQKTLGHPVQGSTRLRGTPVRLRRVGKARADALHRQ